MRKIGRGGGGDTDRAEKGRGEYKRKILAKRKRK